MEIINLESAAALLLQHSKFLRTFKSDAVHPCGSSDSKTSKCQSFKPEKNVVDPLFPILILQ